MREGERENQLLDALQPQLPLQRDQSHAGNDDALRRRPVALEVQETSDFEEERVNVAIRRALCAASEALWVRSLRESYETRTTVVACEYVDAPGQKPHFPPEIRRTERERALEIETRDVKSLCGGELVGFDEMRLCGRESERVRRRRQPDGDG